MHNLKVYTCYVCLFTYVTSKNGKCSMCTVEHDLYTLTQFINEASSSLNIGNTLTQRYIEQIMFFFKHYPHKDASQKLKLIFDFSVQFQEGRKLQIIQEEGEGLTNIMEDVVTHCEESLTAYKLSLRRGE